MTEKNKREHERELVGPPGMVNGVHEMLSKTGVDDDDIRNVGFDGY